MKEFYVLSSFKTQVLLVWRNGADDTVWCVVVAQL